MADDFSITEKGILCSSSSGQTYRIERGFCSCRGFAFRKRCRHYEQAEKLGLLDRFEKAKAKGTPKALRSPYIVDMRKKAIDSFLRSHDIFVSSTFISKIEPRIKITTPADKVLKYSIKHGF